MDRVKPVEVVYGGNADVHTSGGEDEFVALAGNGFKDAAVHGEGEFATEEIIAGSDGPATGKYMEPVKGMLFDSENNAIAFSQRYAQEKGFAITRRTSKTTGEKVQYFTLACNRQGNGNAQCRFSSRNKLRKSPCTRTPCLAKLNFRLIRGRDKFCLNSFILEHNHDLSPRKTRVSVCQNKTLAQRRRPDSSGMSEVCANKMFISTHAQGGGSKDQLETAPSSEDQQFGENERTDNSKEEMVVYGGIAHPQRSGGEDESVALPRNGSTDVAQEDNMDLLTVDEEAEFVEIVAGSDGPATGKYMEPVKGMIFDSENDVLAFSQRYAQEKGFAITWRTSKTTDEKLQYFTLACNRQGKAQSCPTLEIN